MQLYSDRLSDRVITGSKAASVVYQLCLETVDSSRTRKLTRRRVVAIGWLGASIDAQHQRANDRAIEISQIRMLASHAQLPLPCLKKSGFLPLRYIRLQRVLLQKKKNHSRIVSFTLIMTVVLHTAPSQIAPKTIPTLICLENGTSGYPFGFTRDHDLQAAQQAGRRSYLGSLRIKSTVLYTSKVDLHQLGPLLRCSIEPIMASALV